MFWRFTGLSNGALLSRCSKEDLNSIPALANNPIRKQIVDAFFDKRCVRSRHTRHVFYYFCPAHMWLTINRNREWKISFKTGISMRTKWAPCRRSALSSSSWSCRTSAHQPWRRQRRRRRLWGKRSCAVRNFPVYHYSKIDLDHVFVSCLVCVRVIEWFYFSHHSHAWKSVLMWAKFSTPFKLSHLIIKISGSVSGPVRNLCNPNTWEWNRVFPR